MTILDQTDTGRPCPKSIQYLKKQIDERGDTSMMMYISVSAWELAKVLDRLEYLERYEIFIKETLAKSIPYK